MQPIVLDLDGSVHLDGAGMLDRRAWQETLRFACTRRDLERFDATLPDDFGSAPVFFGSGDFHHLSYLLIRRAARRQRCRVVVFDNHPDNMRFPFGIHCGSWVSHAAAWRGCRASTWWASRPTLAAHLWENRWAPLRRGARALLDARYRHALGAAARAGSRPRVRRGARPPSALLAEVQADAARVYLSIDKDVLHPDDASHQLGPGWLRADALCAVAALAPRLVGMDVNGEISAYTYRSRWKRWLMPPTARAPVPLAQLVMAGRPGGSEPAPGLPRSAPESRTEAPGHWLAGASAVHRRRPLSIAQRRTRAAARPARGQTPHRRTTGCWTRSANAPPGARS